MFRQNKVIILSCSGMGKVYGLMAREAVLKTVGELCPKQAETMCLAKIVAGDMAAEMRLEGETCITVDGCTKLCAAKCAGIIGGDVREQHNIMDFCKVDDDSKLGTATLLHEEGWKIADDIADRLAEQVRQICEARG